MDAELLVIHHEQIPFLAWMTFKGSPPLSCLGKHSSCRSGVPINTSLVKRVGGCVGVCV